MKIRPVGAELFHADGRTDMKKQRANFRNFVNASKKNTVTMECVEALLLKQAVQPHSRTALCIKRQGKSNGLDLVWPVLG
jgi:hypothetical protein